MQKQRSSALSASGRVEGAGARRWAEVRWVEVRDWGRALPQGRVVPLPLALVAVALPFLVAWASSDAPYAPGGGAGHQAGSRAPEAVPALPEPLVTLGRQTRLPEVSGGYVDVWGPPSTWESRWLKRRGYTQPK